MFILHHFAEGMVSVELDNHSYLSPQSSLYKCDKNTQEVYTVI